MPRYSLYGTCSWVPPQRVATALALEIATVPTKVAEQTTSLQVMTTVSWIASGGTPRKPSSRRSSRMNAMASLRLSRAFSLVLPCPFCAWDFRTVGDVPLAVPLYDGREFIMHYRPPQSSILVNSMAVAHLAGYPSVVAGYRRSLKNRVPQRAFNVTTGRTWA